MTDDTVKRYCWCTIPEYGDMRGIAAKAPDGSYAVIVVPDWFTDAFRATDFYQEQVSNHYIYMRTDETYIVLGEAAPPLKVDVDRKPFYLSFASRHSRVIDAPDGWEITTKIWLGDKVVWQGWQIINNPALALET